MSDAISDDSISVDISDTSLNSQDDAKFNEEVANDDAVLKLYVNKNDEYVDSLIFTRQENLPSAKGKNGWVELSSGSMILKDDFVVNIHRKKILKICDVSWFKKH